MKCDLCQREVDLRLNPMLGIPFNRLSCCNDCQDIFTNPFAFAVAIPLKIVGKERARVVTSKKGKTRAFTPERTTKFENDLQMCLSSSLPAKPHQGPVRVETTVFVPHEKRKGPCITKPDVDNALKSILDSLKGRAYVDDCQVWRETTTKIYAKEPLIKLVMWFDKWESV